MLERWSMSRPKSRRVQAIDPLRGAGNCVGGGFGRAVPDVGDKRSPGGIGKLILEINDVICARASVHAGGSAKCHHEIGANDFAGGEFDGDDGVGLVVEVFRRIDGRR